MDGSSRESAAQPAQPLRISSSPGWVRSEMVVAGAATFEYTLEIGGGSPCNAGLDRRRWETDSSDATTTRPVSSTLARESAGDEFWAVLTLSF